MQKYNDNKNILIWDNETGECLDFIAQIKGRLNLQDDIIKDQEQKIAKLVEENQDLRKKILNGLFDNCTLENENDILHLQYVFTICKLLVDDAIEEVENENIVCAVDLAEECIYQFESRMKHFNQDKNGETRVF